MANPIYGSAFLKIVPDVQGFGGTLQQSLMGGGTGGLLSGIGKHLGGLIGVGVIAGVAGGLAAIGDTFDSAFDTIRTETGAMGGELEGLEADFKEVFSAIPTDAQTAADAVAEINKRLGLTGEPLQDLAKQFVELSRLTGVDMSGSIESVGEAFEAWDVSAIDEAPQFLDAMFRASQLTGIGVDELATSLKKFRGPLSEMGFGFDESVALLANFEDQGVNTQVVMAGLRTGLGKMAKEGEPARETFTRLVEEISKADKIEGARIAFETFGSRAGPEMARLIQAGALSIDDLYTAISSGEDTILGAAEDTNDWKESLNVLKNKVLVALEPVATRVFGAIGTAIEFVTPAISTVVTWLSENLPRAFEAVRAVVGPVFETISGFFSNLSGSVSTSGLGTAISGIGEAFGNVVTAVRTAIDTIADIVGPIFETIVGAFQANSDKISGIGTTIGNIFSGLADIIRGIFDGIKAFWAQWGDEIMAALRVVVDTIVAIVGGVIKVFQGIIDFLAGVFTGDWKRAWEGLKTIFSGIWETIKAVVVGAFNGVLAFFGEWIGKAANKISEGIDNIKEFFRKLPGQILDFLKELPGKMLQFGKDLVGSILNGLGDMASRVYENIKNAISNAIDAVKRFFGFGSPSRWMAREVGLPIGQGVLAGTEQSLEKLSDSMTRSIESAQADVLRNLKPVALDVIGADSADVLNGVQRNLGRVELDVGAGAVSAAATAPTTVVLYIDPDGKERLAEFVVDWQARRIRQTSRAIAPLADRRT